jgi:hypothetical protein
MDRRHRWSCSQEDFPSLLDELVSLFKTASQQTFNAMRATARKHKRSCSTELCLSIGRESGPRRVEILSFSSSWSTLARCLHQGLRYGYVRVDSDEMYFVLVRQYTGEGRRALQLLFASLAWVTVEQRDRDLQSTASTGHSISRRSFQRFYLIALGLNIARRASSWPIEELFHCCHQDAPREAPSAPGVLPAMWQSRPDEKWSNSRLMAMMILV